MITEIVVYEASDGVRFSNLQDAQTHEMVSESNTRTRLVEWLLSNYNITPKR